MSCDVQILGGTAVRPAALKAPRTFCENMKKRIEDSDAVEGML